jgi:sortase A
MVVTVRKSAKKSQKSKKHSPPKAVFSFRRHLLPPLLGLLVMLGIYVVLNSQMLVAQANYHFMKPAAIAAPAPTADTKSPLPAGQTQLTIPSIGATAPIVFEPKTAEWAVQQALRDGVDHYGGTANPGQVGNTVIVGHSSGQLWAPGDYKFVFTLLDKIKAGDLATIDYQGTRYTYKVTGTEIILPSNLSVLNQNSAKPSLTLITCTPVGTSKFRLVVHADQISPSPAQAAKPAADASPRAQPQLPNSAHTSFWKSLTGWL